MALSQEISQLVMQLEVTKTFKVIFELWIHDLPELWSTFEFDVLVTLSTYKVAFSSSKIAMDILTGMSKGLLVIRIYFLMLFSL